jgi:hypothetical protein
VEVPKMLDDVVVVTGLETFFDSEGDETSVGLFANEELPNGDATEVFDLLIENDELPKMFAGGVESVFGATSGEQMFTPVKRDLMLLSAGLV